MSSSSEHSLLHFNGINVVSGGYGVPPMTSKALGALISGKKNDPPPPPPENEQDLKERKKRDYQGSEEIDRLREKLIAKEATLKAAQASPSPDATSIATLTAELDALRKELSERTHYGVKEGVDPIKLEQAGWGVVFPHGSNPAIREALEPLLKLRSSQAGKHFQIYEGKRAYRPGEKKSKFLKRNGASPSGPADPDRMPYYLMLVGSPEEIPYSFQYQLDVQYAVGRLWFPTLEQYDNYARSVVQAEKDGIRRPKRVSMFGVLNPDDPATDLSSRLLAQPLAEALEKNRWGWELRRTIGKDANHAALESMLGGSETPALLFAACHGVELPPSHSRQQAHQGALLCSDWPGPKEHKGPIPEEFYFAGDHLSAEADVSGMMLFCFACYGAGTPQHDEFARLDGTRPKQIAEAPFISALPLSLLGRPNGALAVVGHVDRAWGCSFTDGGPKAKSYITPFQSALERLIDQQPVGHALDYFNARYAELSTELTEELQDEFITPNPYELAMLWTANNDARGYVVFGDPAARLDLRGGATVKDVDLPPISVDTADVTVSAEAQDVPPRPAEISQEDWERTPLAVKRYIATLQS